MECCNWDARKFFLTGMRGFFGVWLLYAGVSKWVFMGPTAFVGWVTGEFANTWSPAVLNTGLAWFIIIAEPLFALWVLSGIEARKAWMSCAFLMFLLMFGQTMLMKYDVVANNWQYLVLCLACAALHEPEKC